MIRIIKADESTPEELTKPRGSHADVSATVSDILDTVRRKGTKLFFGIRRSLTMRHCRALP